MRCVCGWSMLALSALVGCDPTSGLADTADAALPTTKRYFDGPGTKLTEGPWNRVVVDLDVDTLYHVGARRLDDEEPTFHLFGTDAREGCGVSPNAGTWLMGKPEPAPFRLLPYLESIDDRGRGRLRFTTLDCDVQSIAIEDAGRPYPRTFDQGYLVPTKQGYTFVDPWAGESYEVAERLQRQLVWSDAVLIWADDKLMSFSEQFEPKDELGDAVVAAVQVGNNFLIEDAGGISAVWFDREELTLTSELLLADACGLQGSSITSRSEVGAWVVLQLPCGNPRPSVLHLDGESFDILENLELPLEVDSRNGRVLVVGSGETDDPRQVFFLHMTEVDEEGLGRLWGSATDAEPILIGEHADLDTLFLEPSDSEWAGVAQVNYQLLGDVWTHDWIHFRWDGTTEPVAERVVRNTASGEVLVNFDGVAGDLPLWGGEELTIIAEDVPPYAGEASSFTSPRRHARVDQFDGVTGRVVLSNDNNYPALWDPLGTGVTPESLRFTWFMPAVMFLENWDAETTTGSLVAYNYELEARTTIAEGVSSFDLTSYPWDGVIYAVPYGKRRGVWFSKAK
jgi:hypothetical protein